MISIKRIRSAIYQIVQDIFLAKIDNRYIVSTNSAFSFTGYSDIEKCLYLYPDNEKPLYAIKVAINSNMPQEISYFKRLLEIYGMYDDIRLFLFYSKSPILFQDNSDTFCTKNSFYIYSFNKSILKEIANYYDLDLLEPMDIVRSLLDISLSNYYVTNSNDFSLKALEELVEMPTDKLYFIFKALFAEGVYSAVSSDSDYRVFQAIGSNSFFTKGKPDLINAIKLDWRGYLAVTMELNTNQIRSIVTAQKSRVSRIDSNKLVKDGYRLLYEYFDKDPSSFVVLNILYVTDNIKSLQTFSESLNINFVEKKIFKKDFLYQTPIKVRDTEFDFILPVNDANKFLSAFLMENTPKTMRLPESCGKDVTNNYTTFTFFSTALPHSAVIAKSRSGKTFFIQKILLDAMRAKVKKDNNYLADNRNILDNSPVYLEDAHRLRDKDIGIVHFDVGYSAKKFVYQLNKLLPNQVEVYSDNLNLLRFGLTNVRVIENRGIVEINTSDALFMIQTINTILELSGQEPLNTNESNKVINVLAKLFSERTYQGLTIQKLKDIGGYDKLISKIEKDLGKKLDDYITTVELELPMEYSFLQVPLLQDIVKELEIHYANFRTSKEDKQIIMNSISKLKSFEGNKMFWYYAKNNITQADYFYMELESIKKLGDQIFIPVYLMMFQSLYRRDIENAINSKDYNKDAKEVIYIIEEAHNFFKVSSFASMFEALSREAARYGIVLVFITQNARDIPESILINLGNKIIMPASGEDRELQVTELPYIFQLDDTDNRALKDSVIYFFKKYAQRYSAVIQNSNGIYTFKPYASREEIWLFNSDAISREF